MSAINDMITKEEIIAALSVLEFNKEFPDDFDFYDNLEQKGLTLLPKDRGQWVGCITGKILRNCPGYPCWNDDCLPKQEAIAKRVIKKAEKENPILLFECQLLML
jgi:hypothetical protein